MAADARTGEGFVEHRDGWHGRGVVLIADDDDGAREYLGETLSRVGFDVIAASDGSEAIDAFRAHCDAVRLLVLDLVMPGPGLDEIVGCARRLRAELPLLVVSGYAPEHGAAQLARARFLPKPFLPDALISEVRTLLGE